MQRNRNKFFANDNLFFESAIYAMKRHFYAICYAKLLILNFNFSKFVLAIGFVLVQNIGKE